MSMGLEAATISFFPKISRWFENFSSPELVAEWGVGNWFLGSSLLPTPYPLLFSAFTTQTEPPYHRFQT